MKKAAKKLLFLVCFGGCAYLLGKLAKKEEVQEKRPADVADRLCQSASSVIAERLS